MITHEMWFWCGQCDEPAVKCYICHNTSCNGGGCEYCNNLFNEVTELINNRLAPSKDTIPYHEPFKW